MKQKSDEWEKNQITITPPVFIEAYNKSIPSDFPHASTKALKKFQMAYPLLFKKEDEWSINRHRKKLMDWLFTYRDAS